jgi:23S rRNA (uracil1939-C5)-methyltransferase
MTNRYDEKERRIHCAFSEKCGGCDYAGMKYDNELAVKQKYIEELFGEYVKVDDIVGMYRPIYYRNKVHAVVGLDDSRNVIAGTYEENSHRIVDTSDCMIEDSQCTDIIKDIKGLIASFKYQPYDEDAGKGMIRHILLRKGFSTKEIMLVIVTAGVAFPSKNNFLKALCEKHPEITTIVQNINDRRTSMVLGKRNIVLKGKGYIEDVLCGCRFRISPTSFYQINHQQTEKLYKKAIQLADISKNDTVIDAYCGIGTIGIVASKKAGKVIGVELNSEAVSDAKINASINNIKNVTFVNADAGDFLVEYAKNAKADVVIMDPPRSGSTPEFLNSLLKIKPDRIVYISCGPDTQARDIKVLVKGGYKVTACQPFDLFPHTEHVETVILLSRKAPDAEIKVRLDMSELDITSAESKATYKEIQEYVKNKYDLHVTNLYIAQVKREFGIIERENYNTGEGKAKVPQVTPEKREAIIDALKYFQMIE